jgi:mono/diheme cytochrome c family protein
MRNLAPVALMALVALVFSAMTRAQSAPSALVDSFNRGAALAGMLNCDNCHGAGLRGSNGRLSLYGIERRRSPAQVRAALLQPLAPMPAITLSDHQLADLITYLQNLDGGAQGAIPEVSWDPWVPSDRATVTVRFDHPVSGTPTVQVLMHMGRFTHGSDEITLVQTRERGVMHASVPFTMGGAWVLLVRYGDERLELPLQVGGS